MINWKLRFKNKTTLAAMIVTVISFIYFTLEIFGVAPKFEKDLVVKAVLGLIDLLAILGIVVDPTTKGVGDSDRALNYDVPATTFDPGIEFADPEDSDEDDEEVDDEEDDDL